MVIMLRGGNTEKNYSIKVKLNEEGNKVERMDDK
jgi:hypothetical protein